MYIRFLVIWVHLHTLYAQLKLLDGAEGIRAIGIVSVGSLFGEEVDGKPQVDKGNETQEAEEARQIEIVQTADHEHVAGDGQRQAEEEEDAIDGNECSRKLIGVIAAGNRKNPRDDVEGESDPCDGETALDIAQAVEASVPLKKVGGKT